MVQQWLLTLKKKWKKLTRKVRRWKRRLMKKYPQLVQWMPVIEAGAILLAGLLLIGLIVLLSPSKDSASGTGRGTLATPVPVETPAPEATSAPTPVPTPTPTPEPVYIDGILEDHFYQTAAPGKDYSNPAKNKLTASKTYVGSKAVSNYARSEEIHMPPSSQYSELEGITTFRGSNYRDGGSYGTIPENPTAMSIIWEQEIGRLDKWTGVGWTGQASAVRWPEELKQKMNIIESKKNKEGLIEGIYGTLDGRIYFFDIEDGQATRAPINIGASIKGSVTIDPRGIPLLYCGQGIYEVNGERVKCGTRVWSLIDQSLLYMLNGDDDLAIRKWRAFDCSPLIDAATDTMITAGENGVLYTLDLNTQWDGSTVSIKPDVTRYVYKQSLDGQVGTEGSVTCYNNYVYFANNVGIIQCVDMNTMQVVWSFNAQDDTDASMALEVEENGNVNLYVANEQDKRGAKGRSQMFKLNALTGELLWSRDSDAINQHDENGGGSFATPAVGKHGLSDLVYYQVARIGGGGGMLYAINKHTGDIAWQYDMGRYGWSSPTCVYTPSGKGYVIVGSSNGLLRMFDGLTGAGIAAVDLGANIEGSPIVFDDTLVVGTRGSMVYGIKILAG